MGELVVNAEKFLIEKAFDATHPDVDEHEATQIKSLIRRILQYDPAKRPSAEGILEDPWFCET
ncbi:hypothetical protein RRF57_011557 [Xylaria bambusicola]|uniref:Protein kinase domain-containing protein n=1 Tax=Xylaria bambusicola TaxID=326684 RepID=A0AAN7UN22_9PEZI